MEKKAKSTRGKKKGERKRKELKEQKTRQILSRIKKGQHGGRDPLLAMVIRKRKEKEAQSEENKGQSKEKKRRESQNTEERGGLRKGESGGLYVSLNSPSDYPKGKC